MLHGSTVLTPYFFVLGRSPTLPIDGIICSAVDIVSDNINVYIKHQKDKLLPV